MATDVTTKLLTAEEFMAADLGDGNFELVRGEVIQLPPPMPEHGVICVNVAFVLAKYGRQTGYGYALSNDSAVVTERGPDTVRGADVSFYSHDRWPRSQVGWKLPPVQPNWRSRWFRRAIGEGKSSTRSPNISPLAFCSSGSSIPRKRRSPSIARPTSRRRFWSTTR